MKRLCVAWMMILSLAVATQAQDASEDAANDDTAAQDVNEALEAAEQAAEEGAADAERAVEDAAAETEATANQNQQNQDAVRQEVEMPKKAVAVLIPTKGNNVKGVVIFEEQNGGAKITGKVINLEPGMHGFHIHEFGDIRKPDGTSAGGHFDPEGHMHGGPDEEEHHYGDLGNIEANEEGVAMIDMTADWMQVHFILGRGLVVHGGQDDLESQPSGDAGPRVAVGVVGVAQESGGN